MNLPKLTSIILFVISTSFFNANASFNLGKLDILCKHVSSDSLQCLKEVKYLKISKKKDTTLKYCLNNTNEFSSFTACLNENTNPMLFLKYKKNKEPSVIKINAIKKEMLEICKKNSVFGDCLVNGSLMIEKSMNPSNWIENHCIRENKKYNEVLACKNSLIEQVNETKGVLKKTAVLNETIKKITNLFEQKRFSYMSQAFSVCTEKYGENIIAYECMQDFIKPIKEDLVYLKIKTLPCLRFDKLSDFMICLKK